MHFFVSFFLNIVQHFSLHLILTALRWLKVFLLFLLLIILHLIVILVLVAASVLLLRCGLLPSTPSIPSPLRGSGVQQGPSSVLL